MKAVISSTGLWTPEESITNEELVESFNAYVDIWNSKNSSSIIDGKKLELVRGIRFFNNDRVNLISNIFSVIFALLLGMLIL